MSDLQTQRDYDRKLDAALEEWTSENSEKNFTDVARYYGVRESDLRKKEDEANAAREAIL
jgi:hypothetical protein